MITPLMAFTSFSSMLSAILIVAPILVTAQPYQNVTLGSQIVAGENVTWLSPSGDFAFGFQEIIPGRYLLAIWFNRILERTIVWSANRDNLVGERSTINLLQGGRFELHNPNARQPIWNADSTISAYGAMLDNGNFVLANSRSIVVWQSFDHPTDTILPGQTINQGGALVSSFSNTNYSRGRFRYDLQASGNFVLSTRNFPTGNIITPYHNTNTAGVGSQVIFNQSGYIFLTTTNGTVIPLSSNAGPTTQLYHRAILEYDGVFRHYVYPRSADLTSGWSAPVFWPPDICNAIMESPGPGACGFNTYCSMGDDQRPRSRCHCPNSYSPVDPSDWMSGCKPDFAPQSCESGEADHFSIIYMNNTNFPLDNIDYEVLDGVTDQQCRQACLVDCFCALATYSPFGTSYRCWKKRFPLSNGRTGPSLPDIAMIKVRTNITTTNSSTCIQQENRDRSTLIITGSVSLGSSVFLNLLLLILFFAYKRKSKKAQVPYVVFQGLTVRSFSFTELQEATSGFSELLGSGALSTVYRGVLKKENGNQIAVKRLGQISKEAQKEFKAEVSAISKTNHRNLIQLLGCCDEGQNKLLVYEFMSNGDLSNFIFENSRLEVGWYKRAQIGVAVANGICYLHEECSTQIIHCDIKPQNILLDDSLNAKVSDFGLAKLLMPDQTRTTTGIRGTRGYVAPEWFRNMPITAKVDVYSFGILLLELICCRRNVKEEVGDERRAILADWAYDCYREGTMNILVPAHDEEAMSDIKTFMKFVMIAIWCIQEDPSLRPNMKRVLHMLEGSVEVPIPPDPESVTY